MKTQIISLSLATALLFQPAISIAADNGGFERDDPAAPKNVLPDNRGINTLTTQQTRISRRQAINIASDRFEGRVLGLRLDNGTWRVRMDREGTVFNVFVNATSGDVSASSD